MEGECCHHYVTLTPRVTRVKDEDRPCFTIEADTVDRLLLPVLLATVVQKVGKITHPINLYPLESAIGFPITYPLDI